MKTLKQLQEIIHDGFTGLRFSRPPSALYDPIIYTLGLGGKRLRPALCLLACDMYSNRVEQALYPALGIEIFHNFTLLHDDIMDKAPIRRGQPTVYKKWDTNVAILSGDTMMALAYDYLMKAPDAVRFEVFSIFNQTAIEVCEGQQYDMDFESQDNVSLSEYMEMIRLKTAVLLAASLKLGAIIGGANPVEANLLYDFGENIGIAFQLMDDLLDVFSDVKKFGKTTGGDILSHKKTFLYLKAHDLANKQQLHDMDTVIENDLLPPEEKVKQITWMYISLDIKKHTENEMQLYYDRAMKSLDKIRIPEQHKLELINFASRLKDREF